MSIAQTQRRTGERGAPSIPILVSSDLTVNNRSKKQRRAHDNHDARRFFRLNFPLQELNFLRLSMPASSDTDACTGNYLLSTVPSSAISIRVFNPSF